MDILAIFLSANQKKSNRVDCTEGLIISIGLSELKVNREGKPIDPDNGTIISLNRGRIDAYKRAREKALDI